MEPKLKLHIVRSVLYFGYLRVLYAFCLKACFFEEFLKLIFARLSSELHSAASNETQIARYGHRKL